MTPTTTAQPVDALPWLNLERELRLERPRQWAKRFQGASPNECNRILITLSRHATNRQIVRLLQILDRSTIGHKAVLTKWRERLLRLSPTLFNTNKNYRVEHHYSKNYWLSHYHKTLKKRNACKNKRHQTIIAFTGNSGLLMAPIPCILAALAEHNFSLVVVRRRYKTSYFERDGDLLRAISEQVLAMPSFKRHQSIALGTSSGGLAALCTAQALRLPLGIAIGAGATADILNEEGPIAKAATNLMRTKNKAPWPGKKTRLFLAASRNNETDVDSAIRIIDYFNTHCRHSSQTQGFFFADCGSHTLPQDLALNGIPIERLLLPFLEYRTRDLPKHKRHPSLP